MGKRIGGISGGIRVKGRGAIAGLRLPGIDRDEASQRQIGHAS
jgi:hypothetical protein